MANRFANGAKAFGFCDVCGFRFDLKKLKNLVVKTKQTQIKACPQCWTPDQPQLQLGMYEVSDPQAIRDPRPDTNTWYQSGTNGLQTDPTSGTGPLQEGYPGEGSRVIEWGWAPIGGSQAFDAPLTPNALVAQGQTGTVTAGSTGGLTSQIFTTPGTTSWTAPASVTRALVICVGGGGSGRPLGGATGNAGLNSSFGSGLDLISAGGGQPGSAVYPGPGAGGTGSSLSSTIFGGNGGDGGDGGGGAGGYSGNGGVGSTTSITAGDGAGGGGGGGAGNAFNVASGGGVGLNGQGANGISGGLYPSGDVGGGGSGGQNGSFSAGGLYGGGGGGYLAGGGGGGLRWTIAQVVPATTYPITVGGGGASAGSRSDAGGRGAVAIHWVVP